MFDVKENNYVVGGASERRQLPIHRWQTTKSRNMNYGVTFSNNIDSVLEDVKLNHVVTWF